MIGLLLAGAAAISVAATAVDFILDELTESERRHQQRLRGSIDDVQRQRQAIAQQSWEEQQAWLRQQAKQYKKAILAEVNRLNDEHAPIEADLTKLQQWLDSERARKGVSSFRMAALQKSQLELDDAVRRLQAHKDYREYLKRQAKKLWQDESYDWLLQMPLPEFNLPADWLYEGKVMRIDSATELDTRLPLGHRLHLTKEPVHGAFTDSEQRKLLADYPYQDQLPVQVIKSKNQKLMYGCIARGMLWADYLLSQQSIDFTITREVSSGYIGSLLSDSVHAFLPKKNTISSELNARPGQTLQVWLEQHDLLLKTADNGRERSLPIVTTREPASLNRQQNGLSLAVSEQTQGDVELLADEQPADQWKLVSWCPQQQEITLISGTAEVSASVLPDKGMLLARSVAPAQNHDLRGLQLDLRITVIDSRLIEEPFLQNPEALDHLLFLAQQLNLSADDLHRRDQQVRFIERWQQVLDFQQYSDNEQALNFTATAVQNADQSWQLSVSVDGVISADTDAVAGISEPRPLALDEWNRSLKEAGKPEQYSVILQLWQPLNHRKDSDQGWRDCHRYNEGLIHAPVDSSGMLELSVTPSHTFVTRQLQQGGEKRWRLLIKRKDSSLQRQRKALEQFEQNEMLAPELKELLLLPDQISSSQTDRIWQQRIAEGLNWQNPQLTATQQGVIETCLRNKHLALVQGPPGTAKTTCIVELLHQLFQQQANLRVLVVSQQNAAVDNALSRFIKTGGLQSGDMQLLRLGMADKIQPELAPFSLENRSRECLDQWAKTSDHTGQHSPDAVTRDLAMQWQQQLQQMTQQNSSDSEITDMLLRGHNLIGATCVGMAATHMGMDRLTFDIAIIDEAGRATVPELLIPVLRSRKVILIGDHHQLPPTVAPLLREESSRDALPFLSSTFLENSFFEQLFHRLPETNKARLKEQYRMAAPIGDLVAELFYTEAGERQLKNGHSKPVPPDQPFQLPVLAWQDIKGRHQKGKNGNSLQNLQEAEAIATYLKAAAGQHPNHKGISVAVITPYRAQVQAITQSLKKQGAMGSSNRDLTLGCFTIKVDTVDSFQGSEAQLVCYSTVRSFGRLDFVLDKKRLNVACSRAEEHLIFFGHKDYLCQEKHSQGGQHNFFTDIVKRAA